MVDEVIDTAERLLFADRQHQRDKVEVERIGQRIEGALQAGVVPIHLVDHHHPRQIVLVRITPDQLGADLNARDRIGHHQCTVDHPQRVLDLAHQVEIAGGVDDVDLVPAQLAGDDAHVQRDGATNLLILKIRDGAPFFHLTQSGDGTRVVQHGL